MKPWIKLLIVGITAFGGGFASGFFAHKKINDVQFEEVSEEEMAKIEQNVAEAKRKAEEKVKKENDITSAEELPEDPDKLRNALQGKKPFIEADKETKMAYEKMWNATKDYSSEENANDIPTMEVTNDEEEEFDEDFLNSLEEDRIANDNYEEPPHPITLADFYNDRPEYDKITIEWFMGDNTWIDEKDEVIADITSYIGMEKVTDLFASNMADEDPDVRFIRNDHYQSDYEIIRHHRSRTETVGGV